MTTIGGEKPKTGEGGRYRTAQVGRGDRGRKKNKTGECCSYQTAQFGGGDGQIKKIKTGEDVATAQLILALTKGVVNVGVVLSLNPF